MNKKYILFIVSIFANLNCMDEPTNKIAIVPGLENNPWEIFIEPNVFDMMNQPIPYWDKKSAYKQNISIQTTAHLHILKQSGLETKGLKIIDTTCDIGHTTAFLSQKALLTVGCDERLESIADAQSHYKNHCFANPSEAYQKNFYDLAVACSPWAPDLTKLEALHQCLNADGKIFCILNTQASSMTLDLQGFFSVLPDAIYPATRSYNRWKIDSMKDAAWNTYLTVDTVKSMIKFSNFNIISEVPHKFDILIQDKNHFINFHKCLFASLTFMSKISSEKNRAKITNQFMRKIISLLSTDAEGNWFYPINATAFLLEKAKFGKP